MFHIQNLQYHTSPPALDFLFTLLQYYSLLTAIARLRILRDRDASSFAAVCCFITLLFSNSDIMLLPVAKE